MGHHAVDLPGLDIRQETLQSRPVEVAAAVTAVVVADREPRPTGMGLAEDIRFRGLALGIQRIEVLVESFFGALARVDGTAHRRRREGFRLAGSSHGLAPFSVRPKKKCPEQCEPVTALATALSERYTWPSNAKPCSRTSTCS